MKFARNAKIFRGQLDIAPFAGMFFCLLLFLLLCGLTYTPGVHIQLPAAEDLPGVSQPSVSVAVGAGGQFYFENQLVQADELRKRLQAVVNKSDQTLTLVVLADKGVNYETLIRVTMLAREAGIKNALLATLPGSAAPGGGTKNKP